MKKKEGIVDKRLYDVLNKRIDTIKRGERSYIRGTSTLKTDKISDYIGVTDLVLDLVSSVSYVYTTSLI